MSGPGGSMPVEMHLTRDDLLEAARLTQLAGMLGRRALVIYAVLAAFGFALFFVLGEGYEDRLPIALAGGAGAVAYLFVLILVIRYLVMPLALRRQWREQTELGSPHAVSWTPEHLLVIGKGIRSETTWASYLKWCESTRCLLLYRSSRHYQVVAKRWFSAEQVDEIRGALRNAGVAEAPPRLGAG